MEAIRMPEEQPPPAATVFIVDDDADVLRSMRYLVESIGLPVETFASAQEFLAWFVPELPGCLVLDVRMPGLSGLDLQDQLRERRIEIPVIFITGYGDVPMAVRAMKAGAVEFLQKPVPDQVLLDHIQAAVARDLSRYRANAERREIAARLSGLTPRERQVLDRVAAGVSNREIGEQLGVSPKTVESHRAKVMRKMQATSVLHLVRMLMQVQDDPPRPGGGTTGDA
jgi:RNA polymerase sigma factor (sigma-70 family)